MADFVAGDTGSKLEVTCQKNSDGSVINLTGSTVTLQWKDKAGVLVEKVMTITDAVNGIAEYQFAADELVAPLMHFQVKITDASGKVLHSLELIRETVRAVF